MHRGKQGYGAGSAWINIILGSRRIRIHFELKNYEALGAQNGAFEGCGPHNWGLEPENVAWRAFWSVAADSHHTDEEWIRNPEVNRPAAAGQGWVTLEIHPVLRIRIRDPVRFWPLDPGSRIPKPYFWELNDNFLHKKFCNSLKMGWPKFFSLAIQTQNNFQFCEICGYKTKYDNYFFVTPLFWCCFWIRDPRSGIRDG